jgi:hypothetical protein
MVGPSKSAAQADLQAVRKIASGGPQEKMSTRRPRRSRIFLVELTGHRLDRKLRQTASKKSTRQCCRNFAPNVRFRRSATGLPGRRDFLSQIIFDKGNTACFAS